MNYTIGFIGGTCFAIFLMLFLAVLWEPSAHREKTSEGYYSYPDQTQDKKNCEQSVVRSNNCVLEYKWSPKGVGIVTD